MSTEFERVSSTFDEAGFSRRIDDLVASALDDQAREQKMLIETLGGARNELRILRELVERRDQAVVDMLEARLSGLATQAGVEIVAGELKEIASPAVLGEFLGPMGLQIEDVSSRLDAVDRALKELTDSMFKLDPWKPALEVQRTFRERLAEAVDGLAKRTDQAEAVFGKKVEEALQSVERALESAGVEDTLREAAAELKESVQSTGARTFDRLVQLQSEAETMGRQLEALSVRIDDQAREAGSEIADKLGAIEVGVSSALDQALSQITDRLTGTASEVERGLKETHQRVEESGKRIDEKLEEFSERVEENISEQVADDQARSAAISRQLEGALKAIELQSEDVALAVGKGIDPFAEQLSRFAALLTQANRRLTESNVRMEALQESLVVYLSGRDERLEESRSRAIAEVIEAVAGNLKRRDRIRIGDALKRAEQQRIDRRDAGRYRKLESAGHRPSEQAKAEAARAKAEAAEELSPPPPPPSATESKPAPEPPKDKERRRVAKPKPRGASPQRRRRRST